MLSYMRVRNSKCSTSVVCAAKFMLRVYNTVWQVIFWGAIFCEKSDRAPRINSCGFKIIPYNIICTVHMGKTWFYVWFDPTLSTETK